ncbi:MAG: KEOPS complex kinase/ATPase Bud32 [Candidatus Aenigmatarchaeota archaeon]
MDIIKRGAEAILYIVDGKLVKERVTKGYRVAEMDDSLRKTRTKRESKLLSEASRAGVNTPRVFSTNGFSIVMEWLNQSNLKQELNSMPLQKRLKMSRLMGESLAKLHSTDIIHGDLTTSNMIFKNDRLFFIDFGLSTRSKRVEDKATDLYLLYEALKAAHFSWLERGWKSILKAYSQKYEDASAVLKQLEKIKTRRRYK